MKYHRFEAEDVAEILRHEIEARQAKVRAERDALMRELTGPYKATWDFWQALLERRDVKALADFESSSEFQGALEHSIRVLETSPQWASRPERGQLLVQYRQRLAERTIFEVSASPVKKLRDYVVETVDRVAAYCEEQKRPFDRKAMPGDAGDLLWLMGKLHPEKFQEMELKNFRPHYKTVCSWARSAGHQESAKYLYLEAFPQAVTRLAGVVPICK